MTFLASTHYVLISISSPYILLSLVNHVLDHKRSNYTLSLHSNPVRTGNIEDEQKHGDAVEVNGNVPSVRKSHGVRLGFLDELESLHDHPNLSADSGGIEDVEEVVTKEEKPVGHGHVHQLHDVEQIAGNLDQRPARKSSR